MTRRWSKLAVLIAALAGIGVALCAVFSSISPPNRADGGINMTYQGRTNFVAPSTTGQLTTGQFALFVLHNRSRSRVGFDPSLLEVQTQDGWVTNKSFWPDPPKNWPCFGGVLSPGERLAFFVPLPVASQPWRIQLNCYEKASGLRRLKEIPSDLWHHAETFSGRHFGIMSPAVDP